MSRSQVSVFALHSLGALAYDNGVSTKPPLGWNTWCTAATCGQGGKKPGDDPMHDICTEDEIKEIATAMLTNGLHERGFDRINLDDCWVAANRTKDGLLTPDPARFPSGIKALTAWLHKRGLKFGLYSSMGHTTCNQHGKTWPDLLPGTWPRSGSFGHYKEDAETFASWDVDYVKMDWCGTDHSMDSEELHTNFSHWMNATGRPMHLELCRGYGKPIPDYVAKVANSWRVTGDNWDYWPHTVSTIKSFINVSHLAGPGNWNYGDFLMTGGAGCGKFEAGDHCPGQTDAEYRTQFSVYVLAASPLIIGTDIRNMTPIMKSAFFNDELIAINQDHLAPAGDLVGTYQCDRAACVMSGTVLEDAATTEDKGEVLLWARHASDESIVIGVSNLGSTTNTIEVQLSDLGMSASDTVSVRDVWARKDVPGTFTGSLTATVEPHDTAVWRLRKTSVLVL